MLQGTVRQIKNTPKFILHQNAKFSTRQYFHLYGIFLIFVAIATNIVSAWLLVLYSLTIGTSVCISVRSQVPTVMLCRTYHGSMIL